MSRLKLTTTAENEKFEQEVDDRIRMNAEFRANYVAELLELLEPETWISITTKCNDKVSAEMAWNLSSPTIPNFEKCCRDRDTVKIIIHRKGKNKLTFLREGPRYIVTSI